MFDNTIWAFDFDGTLSGKDANTEFAKYIQFIAIYSKNFF